MATCSLCKLPSTEPLVTVRGKKLCPVCLEAKKKAAKIKDEKRAAKINDPDRRAVEQFVCMIWSIPEIPISVSKQLEQLGKKYRYTDILYTLRYFYQLEEREIPDEPTIGIVPYIIKDALEYRSMLESAAEANASFVADNKPTTITIHHSPGGQQLLGYSVEDL